MAIESKHIGIVTSTPAWTRAMKLKSMHVMFWPWMMAMKAIGTHPTSELLLTRNAKVMAKVISAIFFSKIRCTAGFEFLF